jgi:AhpD family alkylhydroperoxidase
LFAADSAKAQLEGGQLPGGVSGQHRRQAFSRERNPSQAFCRANKNRSSRVALTELKPQGLLDKPSTKAENERMYSKENLAKLKKMESLAPELMKTFWAFDKAAVAEGAIPAKYKELIALAVALTTQCPYCIEIHCNNARKAGAGEAELLEAGMVAASLRAGAAVTHTTHALLG